MTTKRKSIQTITDPLLEPFFITKDEYSYTVKQNVKSDASHFRAKGKAKTYEKSLYYYSDLSETESGIFNPGDSPVEIAFDNLRTVIFDVSDSATSNPITGAIVSIDGAALSATNASGRTLTNLASGTYNYTVSKAGHFSVKATSFEVSDNSVLISVSMRAYATGVKAHKPDVFNFYPNPVNDMLTVSFSEPYSGTVELISLMGQKMMQIQVNDALSETIVLSDLKSGMYFLKAGSNSKLLVKQ